MPRQKTDEPSNFPWKYFFGKDQNDMNIARAQCSADSTASVVVKKAVTAIKGGDRLGTKAENCEKIANQAEIIKRQIDLVPTAQREQKRNEVIEYHRAALMKYFNPDLEVPLRPELPYLKEAEPKPRGQRRGSISDDEDEKELTLDDIIEAEAIIYFRKSFPTLSISVFRNAMLTKYPDIDPELPKTILKRIFAENASGESGGKKSKNVSIEKYNQAVETLKRASIGRARSPSPKARAEPEPQVKETITIEELKQYIRDKNWEVPKTNNKEEMFAYILKQIAKDVSDLMKGYSQKEEEVEQTKEELERQKDKYKKAKQKNIETNKRIEELEQLIERLENKQVKSEEDTEELNKAKDTVNKLKEKLESTQNNLLSEKRKVSDLEKIIEKLEDKNNKTEKEIEKLNNARQELQERLDESSSSSTDIIKKLNQELNEKKKELEEIRKKLEEMKAEEEEYSGLCFQIKDWMKDEKFDLKIAESDLTCPVGSVCDVDKGKCIKYAKKPIDLLNKQIIGSIESVDNLINTINKRIKSIETEKEELELAKEEDKKKEEKERKRKEKEEKKRKEEEERLREEQEEIKRVEEEERLRKEAKEKKRKEKEERKRQEEEERLKQEEKERKKKEVPCATKDKYNDLDEMVDDLDCKDDMVCDVDNKQCVESKEYTEVKINNKLIKVKGRDELIEMIKDKIEGFSKVEKEEEIEVSKEKLIPVERKSLDNIVNTLTNILIKKPTTTAQSKVRMADRAALDKIAKCAGVKI